MVGRPKGGTKFGGRKKGTPNKTTALLKEMILEAAELAGNDMGGGGTVKYLRMQATLNPAPFMSLLGRVLPTQLTGDPEQPVHHKIESDARFREVVGLLDDASRTATGSDSGAGEVAQASPPEPKNTRR